MEVVSPVEQMLFTTVRLETQDASGNSRIGTSFIVGYKSGGEDYPFLVTNKHVISGAHKGKLTFIQARDGRPLLGIGYTLNVNNFEQVWHTHADPEIDIAIAPFAPIAHHIANSGISIFFRMVGNDIAPSEETMKQLDALEEVVFIGYPSGIWDSKNLLPIIRKGITATPIVIDFQGKPQFLIDASVFPGSSGSPVFLYNVGMYARKSGGTVVGSRILFLGIVAEVFYQQDANEIQILPSTIAGKSVVVSKQMIDLGIVYKASAIIGLIKSYLLEKGDVKN